MNETATYIHQQAITSDTYQGMVSYPEPSDLAMQSNS